MPTIHEHAAREAFERDSCDDKLILTVRDTWRRLLAGEFAPPVLVEALMQTPRSITFEDAYGFMLLWADIQDGLFGIAYINVGDSPYRDLAHAENKRLLADLPSPFKVDVIPQRGRSADDDGTLRWSAPIEVEDVSHNRWPIAAGGQAPLEIGSTKISKSRIHLYGERSLARWPYDHEDMVLIAATPKFRPPATYAHFAAGDKSHG